jgi:Erv1 / Alr family
MEGPAIPIWGPALWSLFHTLAAKSGKKTGIRAGVTIESEEKRIWRSLLLAFRSTIPCPACQKHYNEYLATRTWLVPFETKGAEWGSKLVAWFFAFHNAVRSSKGQPIDFTEEQLTRYENTTKAELVVWKQTLTEHLRRSMVLHLMTRDDMMRSLRLLEELILLIF